MLLAAVLGGYYNSPVRIIILPEVIWADASGGGTWISEVQIFARRLGTVVDATFYYAGGSRQVMNLWTSTADYACVRYPNILQTLQTKDPTFTYQGKVGALLLSCQVDGDYRIQAMARTVNGNYGKTHPGIAWADMYSANVDRQMMIQGLINTAAYRTFVGFLCAPADGQPMTVEFEVCTGDNVVLGTPFTKTFNAGAFASFNPFTEAGVTQAYDNCYLWINPTASGSSGENSIGLFCFGSTANNTTNDTAALIAVQYF